MRSIDREAEMSVDRSFIERQREILNTQLSNVQNAKEAAGIEFAYGEMRKLGNQLEDIDLRYRGHQGVDQIYSRIGSDTEFVIVENKAAGGLNSLKTDQRGFRQGSESYNLDRVQNYLRLGDGQYNLEAEFLQRELLRGNVRSNATLMGSARVLEFPPSWPSPGVKPIQR